MAFSMQLTHAISNSFEFGGSKAVLVMVIEPERN